MMRLKGSLICWVGSFLFVFMGSVSSWAALTTVPGKISAPVILYDEGNNPLATGDYGILISLKDDLGNALYTEEQVVRVKDGVAQFVLGDGHEPGSEGQKPTGGLVLEDFVTANVVNVEILVEGQFSPQEITTLGSQPYSFVSQQSLTVAADAILSASIQDGTITPADVSADFTQAIIAEVLRQIPVSTPPPTVGDLINSLSASKISITANLALKNASGTNIEQILKGLDQAIETLREIHLKQGLANLRAEVVLRDGTQAMTGSLNMGGQDILNIGPAGYSLVALLGSIPPGQTLADTFVDTAGDTMTGNLSMGGKDITSIGANRYSLEGILNGLPSNQTLQEMFVDAAGDSMTGNLSMGSQDITSIGPNNYSLVTVLDGFPIGPPLMDVFVNTGGDTMTGNLNMSGHHMTDVGTVDGIDVEGLNSTVSTHTSQIAELSDGTRLDGRYVNQNGDSMSGNLNMSRNSITNADSVAANFVFGNGSGLTNLNGSQITSGTINEARIDSSIARDSEIPSPISDHGALSGLGDNDHPQYLLRNGGNPMEGDLDMGGNDIINVNNLNVTSINNQNFNNLVTIVNDLSSKLVEIISVSGANGSWQPSSCSDEVRITLSSVNAGVGQAADLNDLPHYLPVIRVVKDSNTAGSRVKFDSDIEYVASTSNGLLQAQLVIRQVDSLCQNPQRYTVHYSVDRLVDN